MKIFQTILTAWLTSFLVVYPVTAHADDVEQAQEPVGVEQGETVPFNGVLFPTVTAAKLLADLEASEERCDARVELAVQEAVNEKQLLLDTCNSNLEIRTQMYEQRIQGYQDYSDFLEQRITKPRISPELTFVLGILAGTAITIGAGYTINEIASQ